MFHVNAHRYPAKSWYEDIDKAVGDTADNLERWGATVKAYVGMGWNPTNVKSMLEFFQRSEIPGNKGPPRKAEPAGYQGIREWLAGTPAADGGGT